MVYCHYFCFCLERTFFFLLFLWCVSSSFHISTYSKIGRRVWERSKRRNFHFVFTFKRTTKKREKKKNSKNFKTVILSNRKVDLCVRRLLLHKSEIQLGHFTHYTSSERALNAQLPSLLFVLDHFGLTNKLFFSSFFEEKQLQFFYIIIIIHTFHGLVSFSKWL